MGWAKYNEDDTEIYCERMVQRESADKIKIFDITYSPSVFSVQSNINRTEKKSQTPEEVF